MNNQTTVFIATYCEDVTPYGISITSTEKEAVISILRYLLLKGRIWHSIKETIEARVNTLHDELSEFNLTIDDLDETDKQLLTLWESIKNKVLSKEELINQIIPIISDPIHTFSDLCEFCERENTYFKESWSININTI